MAEICLECLNKAFKNKKPLREKDVIMDYDLCEDCGEWKMCVITINSILISKIIAKISSNFLSLFIGGVSIILCVWLILIVLNYYNKEELQSFMFKNKSIVYN